MSESRSLVRSMVVIGGARAASILLTILRIKLVAILLGPHGIGLLSLYSNLVNTASTAAGLGISTSGVRELVNVEPLSRKQALVRRSLVTSLAVQGFVASLCIWLAREPISIWLLGDVAHAYEVGLTGIGVVLTLVGAAYNSILQGLNRIGDLGRVMVISGLFGSAVGLAPLVIMGESGLIWFFLAQPMATMVFALIYSRRIHRARLNGYRLREMFRIWRPMARLGLAVMLGGLATTSALLFARSRIAQDLGLDAAGQFAAAWSVTGTYVGFLLHSMSADYYPRLTKAVSDRPAANALVNDQTQLGLVIGGPILLLIVGWAPWVTNILYSADFLPAAGVLQWQTVGNVFKLASWPLGYYLIACANGKAFLFAQVVFNLLFLILLLPAIERFGLLATGPSFTIAYFIYFVVMVIIVRTSIDFRWQPLSLGLIALYTILSVGLLALSITAPLAAKVASPMIALFTAVFGLRVVLAKVDSEGRVASRLARIFDAIGWPLRSSH